MHKTAHPVLLSVLLLWLMPFISAGQPRSSHFIYKLISYEIIDSSEVSARYTDEFLELIKDQFHADVYFNSAWVVALQKKNGGTRKSMYNRKSRILYTYFDKDEMKKLRIDSIQALKRKDKELLAAIDTLKSDLQVIEYPKEARLINGFPCHKVTDARFHNPPRVDEIWMAKFANVPDLIFPSEKYFLIEGIPMEIIQDYVDVKFRWGVVEILPVKPDDDIFKQNDDGYEVSVDDTEKLIYEGIQFIRTYEPKKD